MSVATIIIDNSTLAATAQCTTQAALRYVLGLTAMTEDSAPLVAGTAAHAALARYFQTWDTEAALRAATAIIAPFVTARAADGNPMPLDDRLHPTNVLKVLRRWLDTHPRNELELAYRVDPSHIELGFKVGLTEAIEYCGRIDALATTPQGSWVVIEHKTSGQLGARWRRRFRSSSQITGYVWAAQQRTQLPVTGCYVNGIEFGRLPSDDKRKCKTHGVVYAECGSAHATFEVAIELRTAAQIAHWRETAITMARRFIRLRERVHTIEDVAGLPMEGTLNGSCANCQFADFCPLGRRPQDAAVMLVHAPWDPAAHALSTMEAE